MIFQALWSTLLPWGNFKLVLCKTKLQHYLERAPVPSPNARPSITGECQRQTPKWTSLLSVSALRRTLGCSYRFMVMVCRMIWQTALYTVSHCPALRPVCIVIPKMIHWNQKMWWNIIFCNESRFCLLQLDRKVKVWSCLALAQKIWYSLCCSTHKLVFLYCQEAQKRNN